MDGVRDAFTGLATLFLGALAITLTALSLHHSRPHGCVHPTAFPPTWFGECNAGAINTSGNINSK